MKSDFQRAMLDLLGSTSAIHTLDEDEIPGFLSQLQQFDLNSWKIPAAREPERITACIVALFQASHLREAGDLLRVIEDVMVELHRHSYIPEQQRRTSDDYYSWKHSEWQALDLVTWWACKHHEGGDVLAAWCKAIGPATHAMRVWHQSDDYELRFVNEAITLSKFTFNVAEHKDINGLIELTARNAKAFSDAQFGTRTYDVENRGQHDYAYEQSKTRVYTVSEILQERLQDRRVRPTLDDRLAKLGDIDTADATHER